MRLSDGLNQANRAEAPAAWRLLAELRALGELGAFAAGGGGRIHPHPQGNGAPVVVLPGFLTADAVTTPLRSYLRRCGYEVHGWEQGFNLGYRPAQFQRLLEQVDDLHDRHGEQVSLVGWSLGGLYAREMAKLRPHAVGLVVTLGSPIAGDVRQNNAWPIYELLNGDAVDLPPSGSPLDEPPPMRTIAIYSEEDGVVATENARHPEHLLASAGSRLLNVSVNSTHMGLTWNPEVLETVARCLARYAVRTAGAGDPRPGRARSLTA